MKGRLQQALRRTLQLLTLGFIAYAAALGVWRNYKMAHNNARLVGLIHGEAWGEAYAANEEALAVLGEPFGESLGFLGFPWSSRVFGLDLADPILVASHFARTRELSFTLLLGLLPVLALAALLGKVFCSHICPMRLLFEVAHDIRLGLARLGVPLPRVRSQVRIGGAVLVGGLFATLLSSTAVWLIVLPYVSLSVSIFLGVTTSALSLLLLVPLFWVLLDLAVAPGFFCHNLCPTGFALENVGRWSLLRLVKKGDEPCPRGCNQCERACPYGLSPKERTHRPACDNCGRCVVACPSRRLVRRLPVLTAALALGAVALPTATASAHHNKGLPHYGYYENYPQVPTEEFLAVEGRWEIGATLFNFQGMDRQNSDTPNDVKIFLYLYDAKEEEGYTGPLEVEIRKDGERVSRYDRVTVDEEAVYSTRETLPESGSYDLVATLEDGTEVVLPFYVELAQDGVNWWMIGGITLPVLGLFGLAAHGRRRRRRGKRAKGKRKRRGIAGVTAGAVLLGSLLVPRIASAADPDLAPSAREASATQVNPSRVCDECGMIDCPMHHSGDGTEKPAESRMEHYETDAGMVMVMGGMPLSLFLLSVIGILLVSFVATEWVAPRARAGFRKNLIKKPSVYRLLRSRWFQAVPQLFMGGVLVFLIVAGLFGSRIANITPIAVWTLWWGGLVFSVLLLGSVWCFVCPWDGLANLFTRFTIRKRVEPLTLALPYPKWLKNMVPAIVLFVVLTWLELGWGITTDPRATAYMGLAMVGLAVSSVLLFGGKQFCRDFCPVGRICGLYGNFAPVEVRARNPRTCQACTTEDCLHGNKQGYACPTGISLKVVQDATRCTMCTECIKSCDKHNVALRVRPFGADLTQARVPRWDEAWLAVTLLALTLFHGLSMTPAWENFRPGSTSILKWMSVTFGTPNVLNFTMAMIAACAVPVGLYWGSCVLTARFTPGTGPRALFRHFSFSLLPVALFYHLAHNLMHLLMEGGEVVPLLSDPLGTGQNYLGTAHMHVGSLVSDGALWTMQIGLILVGHVFGIVVAHRVGHRLAPNARSAFFALLPMLGMMILLSAAGLSLMHMDMNMRMGRM